MKAPFVWFGGKRRVAPQVWDALGDVDNYVEPFAGSLAVLLGRPESPQNRLTETVNDADGFIANFWRALAADPEAVAAYADWQVNEVDLFARHLWLVSTGRSRLLNGLEADPGWFDPQIAGWWVWGINSWIGGGWCTGDGPWMAGDDGLIRKRPHLGPGQGVNRKLPHLGDQGQGVKRQLPHLGNYFHDLAERLRDVRVCCGDWTRVVTTGALAYGTTRGVFLDPPYLGDLRTADLYRVDDHSISHEVREWALANADTPGLRIVLAGYGPEHDHLIPDTWRRIRYSAGAAYSTTASAGRQDGNHQNRQTEHLWMSPQCLDPATAVPTLFDESA